MHFQDKRTKMMTEAAIIAAVYVALVLLFKPISFGAIQFRIAEALCILPFFSFSAVPGLALGCLLGNFFSGAAMPDVIFGTLATLLAAILSYKLRNVSKWLFVFRLFWQMPSLFPLYYSMHTVYRMRIISYLPRWERERFWLWGFWEIFYFWRWRAEEKLFSGHSKGFRFEFGPEIADRWNLQKEILRFLLFLEGFPF